MNTELIRLFLPVGAGVVLGLFAAFRGFLRARNGAPDRPGFVLLVSGLVGASHQAGLCRHPRVRRRAAAARARRPGLPEGRHLRDDRRHDRPDHDPLTAPALHHNTPSEGHYSVFA